MGWQGFNSEGFKRIAENLIPQILKSLSNLYHKGHISPLARFCYKFLIKIVKIKRNYLIFWITEINLCHISPKEYNIPPPSVVSSSLSQPWCQNRIQSIGHTLSLLLHFLRAILHLNQSNQNEILSLPLSLVMPGFVKLNYHCHIFYLKKTTIAFNTNILFNIEYRYPTFSIVYLYINIKSDIRVKDTK